MPYAIDGQVDFAHDVELYSAFDGWVSASDAHYTDLYLETYGSGTTLLLINRNRVHVANSYLYGTVVLSGNIKDPMFVNCDMWIEYDTPCLTQASVTTAQYRASFVGCRFLGYDGAGCPLVDLQSTTRGFKFVGCHFGENPADTGLVVVNAHDMIVDGCGFGQYPGENEDWHISGALVINSTTGLIVSACTFTGISDDVGIVIGDDVEGQFSGCRFIGIERILVGASTMEFHGCYSEVPWMFISAVGPIIDGCVGNLQAAGTFISLIGTDDAYITGVSLRGNNANYGVDIDASCNNTLVRTAENDLERAAAVGGVNDSGSGTVTT